MALIIPASLAPDTLPRIRGKFFVRQWRGLYVAQKWPPKRGRIRNPNVAFTSGQFSYACRMAANPEPMSYATAVFLSQNTEWLPRDILVMAAYGKLYDVYRPDGTYCKQAYHGSPALAPPQGWLPTASVSNTLETPGFGNFTVRLRIDPAGLLWPNGTLSRLQLSAAPTAGSANIGAMYIGPGATSGSPFSFATAPYQVKVAGAGSFTLATGSQVVTDNIAWAPPANTPLVLSYYYQSPSAAAYVGNPANWTTSYITGNDAASQIAVGYTNNVNTSTLSLIETFHS